MAIQHKPCPRFELVSLISFSWTIKNGISCDLFWLCGCITKWIPSFSKSTTDVNSKFSFSWTDCHTKIKETCQPYYLAIIGLIPLPKILVLCKIQTTPIWIWITNSIFSDDNHYATTAFKDNIFYDKRISYV